MVVDVEEGDLGELALENHDDLQQEGLLVGWLATTACLTALPGWQLENNVTSPQQRQAPQGLPSLSLLTSFVP